MVAQLSGAKVAGRQVVDRAVDQGISLGIKSGWKVSENQPNLPPFYAAFFFTKMVQNVFFLCIFEKFRKVEIFMRKGSRFSDHLVNEVGQKTKGSCISEKTSSFFGPSRIRDGPKNERVSYFGKNELVFWPISYTRWTEKRKGLVFRTISYTRSVEKR